LKQGRKKEAMGCLEKALSFFPDRSELHFHLGLLYEEGGQLDDAEPHYLKALALRWQDPALLHNLGDLYREKGELERAEGSYRAALKADPGWAPAHLGLALLAEARKDWQVALREWRLFLEGKPQSDLADQVRGRIEKISRALSGAKRETAGNPERR